MSSSDEAEALWLPAVALHERGEPVLTRDRRFPKLTGVRVESY